MTTPVEVKVYTQDGVTLIGGSAVPRRDNVWWHDENNGVGSGRFALHLDDQFLVDHPTLLNPYNIVKVRPITAADPVFAWQIEDRAPVRVSPQEKAGRTCTFTGRHVRSLLELGQVLGTGDHRTYDFSAPEGPWYVDSDWALPNGVRQDADPTARANSPGDWPDPTAYWLWATDPTDDAPAGRNWFRSSFTLASPTEVKVWATADNVLNLRINGDVLITTDPLELYAWRQTYTATVVLAAGTHEIGAWVDNLAQIAGNPGGFLCVVGTADADGNLDTVLRRTDLSNWLVHDTIGVGSGGVPGWHSAQILISALTEAQAAGDLPAAVTWDFTDDLDSNGEAWDDRQDIQIPVGEDLLTLSNRWAGTVYDIDMTPDLVLRAVKTRGTDVSVDVEFIDGTDGNITALASTSRHAQVRNVVRFQFDGVWYEVEDTTSITEIGHRRPTTLSFGDAGTLDQATQMATDALVDLAWPQVVLPVASTNAKGPQPYDDYGMGDTVSAPALFTGQNDARVMAITGSEVDNRIDWTTDLYAESESRIPPSRRAREFATSRVAQSLAQQAPGAGRVAGVAKPAVSGPVAAALRGRPGGSPAGGDVVIPVLHGDPATLVEGLLWFDLDATC